jgi:hypothetical protein
MIRYPEFFIEFLNNRHPAFYDKVLNEGGGKLCSPSSHEARLFIVSNPMKDKEDHIMFERILAEYAGREARTFH